MSTTSRATPLFVRLGRVLLSLAFLALLGAWLTQLTGGQILGISQPHFYNDAIALALIGIGCFADAFWHARNL